MRLILPVDEIARRNDEFTAEVRALTLAAGVTQVLHLGSGKPVIDDRNHKQFAGIGIREVAVDNDPLVIAEHQRQRPTQGRQDRHGYGTRALPAILEADLCNPDHVVGSAIVRDVLGLGKPVLLLATAVFHTIPNSKRPGAILARYLDALAPGSYVALSHLTIPGDQDGQRRLTAAQNLNPRTARPSIARPRTVLNGWLRGLDVVPTRENGGRFLHVVAARKPHRHTGTGHTAPRRGPASQVIQPGSPGDHPNARTS